MKKLLTVLMVIVAAFCTAFSFAACDLSEIFGSSSEGGTEENGGTEETPKGDSGASESGSGDKTGDKDITTAPHEHEYEWKTTNPTNDAQGKKVGTCTKCGDTQTVTLPKLTDSRYNKSKDTATCGKNGIIEYSISIDGTTHMFRVQTKATGLHKYKDGVCTVCGGADATYVPHGHSYEDKTDTTGHWTECSCGDKTKLIPHDFTYKSEGDKHWQECSVKGETTEKVEHTYTEGVCVCGAEEPVTPESVKSVSIEHKYGEGKYLWNASDVAKGEYNFYDATLKVTRYNGDLSYVPITVDMLGNDLNLSSGNHNLKLMYGGRSTEFTVFVAPKYGTIEAVPGKAEIIGDSETLFVNLNSPDNIDYGDLSIEGEFNARYNGVTYSGYYGKTPVDERFVTVDAREEGLQTCKIKAGNMSANAAVLGDINVMAYTATESEYKVFLSEVAIVRKSDGFVMHFVELVPGKPYIDLLDIPETLRQDINAEDYDVILQFSRGRFTDYTGGIDTAVTVDDISPYEPGIYGYNVSGDTDLWSILWNGERLIRLSNSYDEMTVPYTVYNSDYTKIRFCRVHYESWLSYEITDGMTLDKIKQDVMKYELYVEYFEKVDGKYVHLVPITEDMIDLSDVDVTSHDKQSGDIVFKDKKVAINITVPYSVTGASVQYTLKNTNGLYFILSDATVNDLGKCDGDVCKEIVLYNNGVAMLKHTGNNIGNVLCGYELSGNKLTILRYGFATAFLTVNLTAKTFAQIDFASATAGLSYKKYSFTHDYDLGGTIPIGWSGTFTAYTGETGYDYAWYVNVHLTGWASTANKDGYAYQIAGVGYLATWAFGHHNNAQAFVLRLADYDWWFEIGTADDQGMYRLTFIKKVLAS